MKGADPLQIFVSQGLSKKSGVNTQHLGRVYWCMSAPQIKWSLCDFLSLSLTIHEIPVKTLFTALFLAVRKAVIDWFYTDWFSFWKWNIVLVHTLFKSQAENRCMRINESLVSA